MPLIICLAEDRVNEETGFRLAILSLLEHAPEAIILLYRPHPTASFIEWLKRLPQVQLITEWPGNAGWNCKPQALLDVLDRGHDSVVWIDTDILISRSFRDVVDPGDDRMLVVAPDPANSYPRGSEMRTVGWGLTVGRRFPIALNSCVLRVTQAHRPLLNRWNELLKNETYLLAQKEPSYIRPIHLLGDQEPLTALLGSTEFADIPVKQLQRGRDVAHTGAARSYTIIERLAGLFHSIPPFFHTQWSKPWIILAKTEVGGSHEHFRRLVLETSPYVALAKKYRAALGSDTDTAWMDHSTLPGRIVRTLGLKHFALRGLPLTVFATARDVLLDLKDPGRKDG